MNEKPKTNNKPLVPTEIRAEIKKKIGETILTKSHASDINFGMKIAIHATISIVSIMAALSDSLIMWALGTIAMGIMFAHGVELVHQALHHLGFNNRSLNEAVGVALGLPMGVSFAEYQASHLRHHRSLGTPDNTEFFDYGDQYGEHSSSLWLWLKRFLMLEHYRKVAHNIWLSALGRDFPGESKLVSRRIRRDYLILLAALLIMTTVSAALGTAVILWAWLLPLCLVAAPVHAAIELPEHFMCDTTSTDVFVNTRSILSNPFMTWLTNSNNLHVEHHLMPGLPVERLPELHKMIAPYIRHYHPSYRDFILSLYKGSLSQPPSRLRHVQNGC